MLWDRRRICSLSTEMSLCSARLYFSYKKHCCTIALVEHPYEGPGNVPSS